MRIFRKRKKFGNFHGTPEDAAPIPDIVYQMGAEAAARYVASRPMSRNSSAADQEDFYGFSYVPDEEHLVDEISEAEVGEKVRVSSPLNFISSILGIGRSKPRERHASRPMDRFVRVGSPVHFNHRPRPPGTPVKFRRRPVSPELLQPRAASPYHFVQEERIPSPLHFVQSERVSSPVHFAQRSRSGSPDVARRLQRAQLSQDLQHIERQQRRQHEMAMNHPFQFIPQYQEVQQPFYPMMNPHVNMQAYLPMQQPQMYSFY